MNQDRFEEARVLARALEEGLQEVRDDVPELVAREVQRVGLTPDETRDLVRAVVAEEVARLQTGSGRRLALWMAGFVLGAVAMAVALALAGVLSS